jgi:uncharacterized membrane protein
MIKENIGGDTVTETLSNMLKMAGIMKHETLSQSIIKKIKETHAEIADSANLGTVCLFVMLIYLFICLFVCFVLFCLFVCLFGVFFCNLPNFPLLLLCLDSFLGE